MEPKEINFSDRSMLKNAPLYFHDNCKDILSFSVSYVVHSFLKSEIHVFGMSSHLASTTYCLCELGHAVSSLVSNVSFLIGKIRIRTTHSLYTG